MGKIKKCFLGKLKLIIIFLLTQFVFYNFVFSQFSNHPFFGTSCFDLACQTAKKTGVLDFSGYPLIILNSFPPNRKLMANKIKTLILQSCFLKRIDTNFFKFFPNLEALDLSKNNFFFFPDLRCLPNLKIFLFDNNPVKIIDLNVFEFIIFNSKIDFLSLYKNEIWYYFVHEHDCLCEGSIENTKEFKSFCQKVFCERFITLAAQGFFESDSFKGLFPKEQIL